MWVTEGDQRNRGQARPRSWCVGWGNPERRKEEERREHFGEDNPSMDRGDQEDVVLLLKCTR